MRLFASLALLALAAFTSPIDAIRSSASSLSTQRTLNRLQQRIDAAEQALLSIQSQSTTQDMPAPTIGYRFDGGYYTDLNGANAATKVPAGVTNIQVVNNNARTNSVLQRTASSSQTNSYLRISAVGLASTFTAAVWVSWGQNGGGTILASGGFSLRIAANGQVSATAGGLTVTDPTALVDASWTHYAVTYDGSNLILYRQGRESPVATASGGSAFTATSSIAVGNNEAGTSGYIGSLDDIRIFAQALESVEVGFVYSDTNFGATKGNAPIASDTNRWWGHIGSNTKVVFANRIAGQPTGGITITNSFIDAELRTTNLFWVRMWGVTGPAITNGVHVPNVGTVTWDPATYVLIIQPDTPVAQGVEFTWTIPSDYVPLTNPTVPMAATSSDSRWQVAVTLDKDQTGGRRQGLRWQAITYTPATIDPNPALIEADAPPAGRPGTPCNEGYIRSPKYPYYCIKVAY